MQPRSSAQQGGHVFVRHHAHHEFREKLRVHVALSKQAAFLDVGTEIWASHGVSLLEGLHLQCCNSGAKVPGGAAGSAPGEPPHGPERSGQG
jgi:hypothetical protein